MENTNSTAWTPELWKNFVSAIYANRDHITENLVRQFLADHGIDYDKVAAEMEPMTKEELRSLIEGENIGKTT